jgi:protein ImuA
LEGLSKHQALANLRARIDTIEKRPLLADRAVFSAKSAFFSMPAGIVHEIFADEIRDTGAALGFALGQARPLLTAERPALLVLQLAKDSLDIGVLYGAGLKSFGIEPDNVVIGRMEDPIDLLWAMEEAIACRAVAAVIADIATPMKALDFTASRRLNLRSAAAGSSTFIIRYGREREASAAHFRWRVMPASSAPDPFDARAPDRPRWHVQLEKGRLGPRREAEEWILDWTGNDFATVEPQTRDSTQPADGAPLPGAHPAALGDRLSQAS